MNAIKDLYCTGKLKHNATGIEYETVRATTIGKKLQTVPLGMLLEIPSFVAT